MSWVRAIRRGWVVRGEVPGPDVDEFAELDQVAAALARGGAGRTLLAVQHPHRVTGGELAEALPGARATLSVLKRTAYREVEGVVAPYAIDGADGSVVGVLCMAGLAGVVHGEDVYPGVVAERAAVIAGLGCLTSAAMLVPVRDGERVTAAVLAAIGRAGPPQVSTVDSSGRRHRVWVLEDADDLLGVLGAGELLVADGNHRVAAARAAGLDSLLAMVTAGPRLRIAAIHRAIVGTGLAARELAAAWEAAGVVVRDGGGAPEPGRVVVECPNATLTVELPRTSGIDQGMVEELLLGKALGLDPEGPRVRVLPEGRRAPDGADAVLRIAPATMADVLEVYRRGDRMPRKSTYFTPKPRSGLVLADLP